MPTPGLLSTRAPDREKRGRRDLVEELASPPVRNRRFWVAQGIVAAVLALHLAADVAHDHGATAVPGFVVLLLLFVPVVYAGTAFGFVGSLAVALQCAIVTVPQELVMSHGRLGLWGTWSILAMVVVCAVVLGNRYEAERRYRAQLVADERDRIAAYLEGHPLSWERLLHMLPDGILLVDESGSIRFANERLAQLSGHQPHDLAGKPLEVLVPITERSDHRRRRAVYGEERAARPMGLGRDTLLHRADGTSVPVDVVLQPVDLSGSPWTMTVVRDDTARWQATQAQRQAEERERERVQAALRALAESEERFRLTFESNVDGIVLVDLQDRVLKANPAFCAMVGYDNSDLVGIDAAPITHPDDQPVGARVHASLLSGEIDQASFTKRYVRRDGGILWVDVQKAPAHDDAGAIEYFVCSVRDVTRQHTLTSQLSHQALHDPLTGLANRRLFEQRLQSALSQPCTPGASTAVVLLDLDNFKGVNDTLGHAVGDELLVTVAHRLLHTARPGDTVARFGGDEFLYLAEGLASPSEADELASRLRAVLTGTFLLSGHRVSQRVSLGVAVCCAGAEDRGLDAGELIGRADIALYEAKRLGKGLAIVFAPGMAERVSSQFSLGQQLERALEHGQLRLHYQPIAHLDTGLLAGFEALMRWQHPALGWVPPDRFIPVAEQTDLIVELGDFALRQALADAAAWAATGPGAAVPHVAVNLSARQLHATDLEATVAHELDAAGLAAERLVLEVTESTVLRDAGAAAIVLERLRTMGVGIALDDFGTGYSSLSSLAALRPTILKVDRSFVSGTPLDEAAITMLKAMVSLGHDLGTVVVAEGIETAEQLRVLHDAGCDLGQGYLFAPALPAADLHRCWAEGFASLVRPKPV